MIVGEKSKRVTKKLYTIELLLLKFLPFLVASICFLNTLLSLFYIDLPILSYIAGMSLIPIIFIYISSYVFQFCEYHRLPLHYVVINIILCSIETYVGIPLSTSSLIALHVCIFGLFIYFILFLYLKFKINEKVNK